MDWNEDGKLELPLAGSSERSENLIIGGDFSAGTLELAAEKGNSVPAIETKEGARIELYEGTNRNWLRKTDYLKNVYINDSYDKDRNGDGDYFSVKVRGRLGAQAVEEVCDAAQPRPEA